MAVLLTHGHFDHMLAADDLRDEYGIPIIACAAEQQVLTDSIKNLSGSWASAHVLLADQWICDGKKLELAGFSIEVFTGTYSGKLLLLSAGRRNSVFR